MSTFLTRGVALAALLLATALGGTACARAGDPPPAPLTRAAQKANGSGIEVSYRLEGEPAVGRPLQVTLVLAKVSDATDATVRFAVDADLRLENASAAPTRLAAGAPTTLRLTVVPLAEGLAYLNVFTRQHGVASSTSIPVQTGTAAAAAQKPGLVRETPSGDKVLSMPVK